MALRRNKKYPLCGAKKKKSPGRCNNTALWNGKCVFHGGIGPGKKHRIKFARILWGTPKLRETSNRVSIGDRWDQAKVEAHLVNHGFDLSKPYEYRRIAGQYVYMQDQRPFPSESEVNPEVIPNHAT